MTLSKEEIEKRIEALRKQREQMIAQVNAIEGGIQVLLDLITEQPKDSDV